MEREYIRLTPSRSAPTPATVIQQLAGLHGLSGDTGGLIRSLIGTRPSRPTFEFLMIGDGDSGQVSFYYGADCRLAALEQRLRMLYPPTVTFERVTLAVSQALAPPDSQHRPNVPTAPSERHRGINDSEPSGDHATSVRERDADGVSSDRAVPTSERATDGQFLPDGVTPLGVSWYGRPTRRDDWMTPLSTFPMDESRDPDERHANAPLTPLIDTLTRVDHPVGVQVLFRAKPDWTHEAKERQRQLREGEDRFIDWLFGELLGSTKHTDQSPSHTGRQRQYLDIEGRARVEAINQKCSQQTFECNIRALSLVPDEADRDRVEQQLQDLSATLDHLDGKYYRLGAKHIRRGLARSRRARTHAVRFLERRFVGNRFWRQRNPAFVLGPAELANFVTVPAATELDHRRKQTDTT